MLMHVYVTHTHTHIYTHIYDVLRHCRYLPQLVLRQAVQPLALDVVVVLLDLAQVRAQAAAEERVCAGASNGKRMGERRSGRLLGVCRRRLSVG